MCAKLDLAWCVQTWTWPGVYLFLFITTYEGLSSLLTCF